VLFVIIFSSLSMLSLSKILRLIPKDLIEEVDVLPSDDIDLNQRDYCHLIKKGEVLSYGENNFTQLLEKDDPIGLAETILAKPNMLRYRTVDKVKLLRLDGTAIRKEINQSGPLVKSIVQYTLKRIFGRQEDTHITPLIFEEEFLRPNEECLPIRKFEAGTWIFRSGFSPNRMYFVERGRVQLFTQNKKELAFLQIGACFGESTLIRGKKHNNSALALEDSLVRIIEDHILEKEVKKEAPIVQLVLFLVLRRLEFTNSLRMKDHFSRKR